MLQQTGMTAPRLQSGHLGGANVEHPWTTPECSGTSTQLMMGFQQRDLDAVMGKKGCG